MMALTLDGRIVGHGILIVENKVSAGAGKA